MAKSNPKPKVKEARCTVGDFRGGNVLSSLFSGLYPSSHAVTVSFEEIKPPEDRLAPAAPKSFDRTFD